MEPFESLHSGHLVTTHHMRSLLMERVSSLVHLTHGADLFSQCDGIFGWRGQPIPLAMRLQSAHLLKNVPRFVEKWWGRCLVLRLRRPVLVASRHSPVDPLPSAVHRPMP